MDSPTVYAPNPPQTPLNNNDSVSVSPKAIAPPQPSPPLQDVIVEAGAYDHSTESIATLSFGFLVKIQQVLGQHSAEWKAINRALLQFKHRAMSKKEAHHIVAQVLSNNDMLLNDLSGIMNHKDADWAPEDWSRPINPPRSLQTLNPTSSDFLQPSHEPNFPQLPSMFQALGGDLNVSRPQISANPTIPQSPSMHNAAYHGGQRQLDPFGSTFEGHPGYDDRQEQFTPHPPGLPLNWTPSSFIPNGLSSLFNLMPNPTPLSQHDALPSWHQDPTLAPPRNFHHEMRMDSTLQTHNPNRALPSAAYTAETYQQYSPNPQRQTAHYMDGWANDNLRQHKHDHNQASHVSHSLHNQATPQLPSGQLSSTASPSTMATPATSVTNSRELLRDELHQGQTGYVEGEQDINSDATTYHNGSRLGLSAENEVKRSVVQSTPKPEGGFIHAICGRGFHSKSAVKKHHWGPKAGDLTTTRGCWAKNRKPDVAWDAHPSCKIGGNRSNTTKRQSIVTEDDNSVTLSPVSNSAQTPSMGFRRPTAYYTPAHGLNALISAASFAERIDAPKPQNGRIDSVVAQLDVQAAVAERNRRTLPPWSTPTGFGTALTGTSPYMQVQAATARLDSAYGPSKRSPSNKVLSSQHVEGSNSSESDTSRTQTIQEDDVQPKVDSNVSKKRQRATNKSGSVSKREKKQPESLSSSPDRKRRRCRSLNALRYE